MSDMLSIGASGVRAYQTALGVTSDNIANAGTAGYTRRTTALRDLAPAGAIGISTMTLPGNGVVVGGIDRSGDAYTAGAVRLASTDLARTDSGTAWLNRIQSVLTQGAPGTRMTGFFAAAQRLAADPTSLAARSAVMEAADGAAQAFRSTGRALDTAASDLDSMMVDGARELSALGEALAKINDGLGRAQPGSSAAAAMADRRDQVLEQMSAVADVSVKLDSFGRAAVRLGGAGGPVLVNGLDAATVGFTRNEEGAIALFVQRGTEKSSFSPTGGALAGAMDGAQRIADARRELNTLAGDFAGAVNDVMELGDDLDGAPGAALFTVGDPASELSLAFTDGRKLAAANRGAGTRDAGNLAALQSARGTAGVENAATQLIAGVAASIEARGTVAAAQGAIRDAAVTARDAQVGVDLDQEAVDLIRFQQAYQASSRVVQVARDTVQTLLDLR
jgi:flagellar hook-associated protein FlgK